ncbi:MAG: 6-phosphofructokinase, partial [Myxococcota bacterium]
QSRRYADYMAERLARVFVGESEGRFDTRVCVLGHLQQGGRPSPADRLLAVRLVDRAVKHATHGSGAVVVGVGHGLVITGPVADRRGEADVANRRRKTPVHRRWNDAIEVLRH